MRAAVLLIAAVFTCAAFASPVITSVSPSSGPVGGGTMVVIRGTGFSNTCILCSPPFGDPLVYFGSAQSSDVTFIDTTTIHAVTPAHIPGRVPVTVQLLDGSLPNTDTLESGFTYVGDVYEAYDPLLFPVFMPPIPGAHGSEFRTSASVWNKHHTQPVTFYGLDTSCTLIDPPLYPEFPFTLAPRQNQSLNLFPQCSQSVGKLFFVPKGDRNIAASLRVWETSRQLENHGVEIPVVRLADFTEDPIALVDVPTDPKFRITLRIYGLNRGESLVNLWFGSGSGACCGDSWNSAQIRLQPGRNLFEPSYAVFTDFRPAEGFPPFPEKINVLVDVPEGSSAAGTPIWAFVTVTNNLTQHITTVTPQH